MPPPLRYPWRHGTAHRIGAELFAQPPWRQTVLCSYLPVFFELYAFFRAAGILAGFAVLGFRDVGPWDSLARQPAAAKLHPNGADQRFVDPSGHPVAAWRSKTGVCEALGEGWTSQSAAAPRHQPADDRESRAGLRGGQLP